MKTYLCDNCRLARKMLFLQKICKRFSSQKSSPWAKTLEVSRLHTCRRLHICILCFVIPNLHFVFVFVRELLSLWAKNLESVSLAHLSTQLHILTSVIYSSDKFDKFWVGASLLSKRSLCQDWISKAHRDKWILYFRLAIFLWNWIAIFKFLKNEVWLLDFSKMLFLHTFLLQIFLYHLFRCETYSSLPLLDTALESEEEKRVNNSLFSSFLTRMSNAGISKIISDTWLSAERIQYSTYFVQLQ